MNPLYVTTSPPPKVEGADAVFQDVEALKNEFGGSEITVYPLQNPSKWILPEIMGLHQVSTFSSLRKQSNLIHVFQPTLRPIPFLEAMGKPIVYTVLTALTSQRKSPLIHFWNRNKRAVGFLNPHDEETLTQWGIKHHSFIPPGIDLKQLKIQTDQRRSNFTLLVGSAPWTLEQFKSKGIETLLDAAIRNPDLELIFLWRGLYVEDLHRQINTRGLKNRVEVINRRVQVADVLARTHATVVLAEHERLVKAYPHSLIESLCAGRPVLMSRCMAMAEQIETHGYGSVLENLHPDEFDRTLAELRNTYSEIEARVRLTARNHYSIGNMIKAYAALYAKLLQ